MTVPRPLLLAGRLDQLRSDVHTTHRRQFRRLLDECERYRGEVPPAEHPQASITYFGPTAANLALAYRLTGQTHYLAELRRWLAPPVSFPHWGKAHMPDHDLDAGWLCHGLSLAYAWAGDSLPDDERAALRDKLILQGTRLYDFAVASEGDWWSSSYWQNHNWICYAGLATAGYVLVDEHPPGREWTERAKRNFATVLELLPEDGSNCEGVVYWRYGVPWIASYLDVLRAAEGLDWFADSPYLRETFWYRLYQAAPDLERIVDHGDCHDRRSGHSAAFYYKLAAEYRIPQAQWLANRVLDDFFWREAYESGVKPGVRPEAYQELLWYDPEVPEQDPGSLPLGRVFGDLGLVVGRTSWSPDACLVSFKASPGGGHKAWEASHRMAVEQGWTTLNAGHHHPDAGSFVLLGHGAYLAVDEGYSNRKLTAHHSSVLVDGKGFVNEDRYHVYKGLPHRHTARIRTATVGDGWVHAVSETAAMYEPELGVRQVDRHLVMSPRGTLVIVDESAAEVPRAWTWLLQTDNPAEPVGDGQWIAAAGSGRLRVTALEPGDTDDEVVATPIAANPTSSTPSLSLEKVQHTLRRTTGPWERARFVTVLEPLAWDDDAPSVISVREGDGARSVVVDVERDGDREIVAVQLDGKDATDALGAEPDIAADGFAAYSVAAYPAGNGPRS
ncbi:DUF4962 domain-containing protein [Phytoactinopolyspora halotolerans]|uniref:DUF4962 domain-containing protein n=1 Tax=Phytoactinopolyspora halotolerans TaxID=1981512 RepID=A0A6L9S920_9ACTN|nr:DUF4962 domain-containing protein [Phytoactinopolyspora halotolerans]NEE01915.1 DUF4962 domain-containing protein [Phytoactinopolyspora halotolerans]